MKYRLPQTIDNMSAEQARTRASAAEMLPLNRKQAAGVFEMRPDAEAIRKRFNCTQRAVIESALAEAFARVRRLELRAGIVDGFGSRIAPSSETRPVATRKVAA